MTKKHLHIAILLTVLAFLIPGVKAVATTADDGMKSVKLAASKLRTTPGIAASFVTKSPQGSESGTITMAGEKFMIDSRSMKVWYDGKTQWTYIPARKEVDITEPTQEELAQVNPYTIIGSLGESFSAKALPGKGELRKVELRAKNKRSDIKTVTLAIDKRNLPVSIEMILSDGTPVSIEISGIKEYGKTPGISTFTFQNKFAPGAELVDLR